ncbi:extracellular solute-binding protein [Hespellia stercorisuis]|uniref:ABC-type glycerol-3-phosphate transport system, substrate-binding protein n=1 Tax=Hespellia stercorisuis DSM 15480 TaxID=1121950 RepID=A0A1M6MN83_9FIRM|nr:extracellular solute-binding protein [Hespellia stercorisuis]SHJ84899.1 ABC-type glycerol-3-phosphate transport system, substrate-binding protein [Hespellia stercorisuis DSM 15480]
MKQNTKKWIVLAMAGVMALMTLSGCSKAEKEKKETAMGRYTEEEIKLAKGAGYLMDLQQMADGTLRIISMDTSSGEYQVYSSDDGEDWKQGEFPVNVNSEELRPNGGELYLNMAPDGEIMARETCYDDTTMAASNYYHLIGTDGTVTDLTVSVPGSEKDGNEVNGVMFSDSGKLYVTDYHNVLYEVDKTTGTIVKTFDGGGGGIRVSTVTGSQCVLVTDSQVLCYDLESGEPEKPDKVLTDQVLKSMGDKNNSYGGFPAVLFEKGRDGGLFYGCADGVYYHADGGSVCEQIINGQLTSLANPTLGISKMFQLEDGSFLIAGLENGETSKLFRYTYDEKTPAVPDKELTVYSLEDHSYLRQAISLFQKAHPDTFVNLEVGVTGEDGVTREDALRTLNTNILAGKGPDVMIMDGMPIDNYIQKDMLMDITDIVQKIKKSDGMFEYVTDAYKTDGKLYAVPAKFYVPMIEGDGDTVMKSAGSLTDLADRVETLQASNPGGNILQSMSAEELLKELFYADSANWGQKDGSISEDAVRDFLTQADRIYNTRTQEETGGSAYVSNFTTDSARDTLTQYIMGLVTGEGKIGFGTLGAMVNFATVTSAQEQMEQAELEYALLDSGNKKSFVPSVIVGISSGTKQEDLAGSFVETVLGSDTGTQGDYVFSANKKAFDTVKKMQWNANGADEIGGIAITSEEGVLIEFAIKKPSQKDMDRLTSLLESLDSPCINDAAIQDPVMEQGASYLRGEQSLEDAVSNIMQKINLYLDE